MTARLTDKVALVFGAGSSGPGWGNGKATAVLFAREGARVVAVDRDDAAAQETAGIIATEGGRCRALSCDVTRSDAVEAIVARTVDAFGRIDILHNNVGMVERGGPVETSEESWRRVLDTNLTSMFLTCKHALPVMQAQRAGAIVNISSIAGVRYVGDAIGYAASKGGVNQFTAALAVQYAPHGIRVNAIMPGLMDTPMVYQQVAAPGSDPAAVAAARAARCPMGFMGTGWDVAHAAVFLASDEARYITGVCLPVDGGISCAMWR
jgi:NAD(P)-dependent dehydrogenase (short-subunit alcohol dehydrogenase family)